MALPLTLPRPPAALLLAVLFAAIMAGACLTQHVFWNDAAYTAILARNLLHTGAITAWHGHNLMAYRGGWTLGSHLIETENPRLQFLLTAGAVALLGQTTFAAILLTALTILTDLPSVPSLHPRCRHFDRLANMRSRHPSGSDALLLAAGAIPASPVSATISSLTAPGPNCRCTNSFPTRSWTRAMAGPSIRRNPTHE